MIGQVSIHCELIQQKLSIPNMHPLLRPSIKPVKVCSLLLLVRCQSLKRENGTGRTENEIAQEMLHIRILEPNYVQNNTCFHLKFKFLPCCFFFSKIPNSCTKMDVLFPPESPNELMRHLPQNQKRKMICPIGALVTFCRQLCNQ